MYVCIYTYIHLYVCTYIYIYIYTQAFQELKNLQAQGDDYVQQHADERNAVLQKLGGAMSRYRNNQVAPYVP